VRLEQRDREFSEFVAARGSALRRMAFLVCGDLDAAEDLVQTALLKLYLAWPKIKSRPSPEAYARQVIVRAHIDETRRPWRREHTVDVLPDRPVVAPGPDEDSDALLNELRRLPPGQRTAIALRYWADVSIEETAHLMGCSPSTVKSQCARGLATLRASLALDDAVTRGTDDDR
jgi:RNA polymerase sigma-70 factor (sigma-E family)